LLTDEQANAWIAHLRTCDDDDCAWCPLDEVHHTASTGPPEPSARDLGLHYQALLTSADAAERAMAAQQLARLARAATPPPACGSMANQTSVEANKTSVDLLTLVDAVVGPLHRRRHGTAVGRCPWHGSRSGTCLVVWPAAGRWWRSCRRRGDAVGWVALVEGISRAAARRRLGLPPCPTEARALRRRMPPTDALVLPDDWRPTAPALPDDWRPGDPLPCVGGRP
jgi:hypothetical protein